MAKREYMHNSGEERNNNIDQEKAKDSEDKVKVSGRRDELLGMLLDTIKYSEDLPPHVRSSFVTYLDLEGAFALIYAILREPQD